MLEYKLPPSKGPLNLLLLGKSGHGKSSTGNTILQLPGAFQTAGGIHTTTDKCEVRWATVNGQVFKVVDTPGVFDPSEIEISSTGICNAIALCPEGFDAVLIVWKYGTKLTPEEVQSIDFLRRIFGQDLLKKHGVFIVTNGDEFKITRKRGEHSHESLVEWMKEQMKKDADWKRIVSECQERCVLFNNRTEEEREKQGQLLDFVETVHGMKSQGNTRLTNELFQQAIENIAKEILASSEVKEQLEKDEKLANKIDAIIKAAAKLPPKEQEEVKNKVRYLQGFRLHLTESMNTTSKCLDEALKDADDLEINVKHKVNISKARNSDWYRSRTHLSDDEVVSELHELKLQADENYRQYEIRAYAAGRRTAEESAVSCFPGNATLRLQDGRKVKMTSLREGDVVLCGRKDGSLIYSAIYMFGHKDEFPPLFCLALSTRTATLRVSHDHLVFRRHLGKCPAVPARHVEVGDAIAVYSPGAATLQWEPVTHIQSQWETGVMAPFTLEGTVVVDDVLASCYVAVTSHTLCHALLWPMRKLAVLAPRLSAHLHRPGEGGLPPWVRLCLHHLLPWLPRHRLLSA